MKVLEIRYLNAISRTSLHVIIMHGHAIESVIIYLQLIKNISNTYEVKQKKD